jgi:hypothetical protein
MADRRVCRRRPAPDTVRLVQGTAWGGLAQSRQRSGVAVGASAGKLTGTCRYQIARASEVAMLPGRAGLQRGTDRPLHTVTIARETVSPGRVWCSLCTSMICPLSRHLIPRCAAPASSRSDSESASEPIEMVLTYHAGGTLRVACASSQVVTSNYRWTASGHSNYRWTVAGLQRALGAATGTRAPQKQQNTVEFFSFSLPNPHPVKVPAPSRCEARLGRRRRLKLPFRISVWCCTWPHFCACFRL